MTKALESILGPYIAITPYISLMYFLLPFFFITIGRNSGAHYESAVPQDKVYSVEKGGKGD